MKRLLPLGMVALLIAGAAIYGAFWLLQTCRPLDRLFGISGCTEIVRVANFEAVSGPSLSAPDAEGLASVFGRTSTVDGWRPAMVRLDLGNGRELGRYPVRALNAFGHVVFAGDRQRAVLVCTARSICIDDGSSAAIVSAEDGSILETRDKQDSDFVYFPGDPRPEGDLPGSRIFAAGGQRIVAVDGNVVSLLDRDGAPVATLADNVRSVTVVNASALAVSPSGAHIALFEPSRNDRPARLQVWNAITGERRLERELNSSYRVRVTPAWTDETHLTLVRREEADMLIEVHRVL